MASEGGGVKLMKAEKMQAVLVMHYLKDMSYVEIAEQMKLTPKAVRMLEYEAIRQIRRKPEIMEKMKSVLAD